MKVADFLAIHWDEPNKVDFIEYCEFLLSSGISEIERELSELLGLKKLPLLSNDQIVEGAIFKSIRDKEKKEQDKNYFKCNAVCLCNSLRRIINEFTLNKLTKEKNLLVKYNYSTLVEDILLDYMDLTNLIRGDRVSRRQHTMSLYQTYRQLVFGQFSYHSHPDREVNISITLIRQAIEVRLRRAIGVLGIVNKDGGIDPMPLSTIIGVLDAYRDSIKFAVPLDKISRVYSWANIFVHTGVITYRWLPVMLEEYLRPVLIGEFRDDGSYDVNNGIEMSEETLSKIKIDLCKELRPNSKLYDCSPEAIIQ